MVDSFSKMGGWCESSGYVQYWKYWKTVVTRIKGIKSTSDGLKRLVFEVNLADLQKEKVAFRKFRLITGDIQGTICLTNF